MRRAVAVWPLVLAVGARAGAALVDIVAEPRVTVGTVEVSGLTLLVGGLRAALRIAPTLELRGLSVLLGPEGTTRDGRAANPGAGGELAFQVVPFPGWPVRPHIRAGAGLIFFANAPFLPGGDVYDFMLHHGAGVEVALGDRFALGIHVHFTHLSNGQGLGSFNPTFDGVGGGVDVRYAIVPGPPPSVAGSPRRAARAEGWLPGVDLDGAAGTISADIRRH
jgi:hypothetical protein